MIVATWLLACAGDPSTVDDADSDADADADADTDTDTDTDADADSDADADTGPACAASDTLSVLGASVSDGPTVVQRAVTVTLSEPATVAVRCTLDGDPDELHLLESDTAATVHELRFSGLLPDSAYTCVVAPTCPTLAGPPTSVAMTTGPRPEQLPVPTMTVDPELGFTGTFTLLDWMDDACQHARRVWLVAFDPEGRARWWTVLPEGIWFDVEALWHPDPDRLVWGGGTHEDGCVHVMDLWDGDSYHCEPLAGPPRVFHHDGKLLPDGRFVTLEERPNQQGDLSWTGFGVRVHDPVTGAVSVELDSQRYVDEGVLAPAESATDRDPYHANWVDHVSFPDGDRVYVSLCFDRSLMSIDAATGAVRWRLAQGEGWTVRDSAGNPLPESMIPECQHGVEVIGDDRLLVYDNGRRRRASQLTELQVDGPNRVLTVHWRWTDGWFEDTLGDIDDLGGGRLLVNQAHSECWSPSPGERSRVIELDRATGRVANTLQFPSVWDSLYRAQRYGGCELLRGTRYCPETVSRAVELLPLFEPPR